MARVSPQRLAAALAILDHYSQGSAPRRGGGGGAPSAVYSGGGGGGGGGGGIGSNIGGLFGKLSQIISMPLHAVTSAEKEAGDFVAQVIDPKKAKANNAHATWSDLWQQIIDPKKNINFGQALGEGNEAAGVHGLGLPGWAAGTGGFALDVANDPLTYVGGVGLAKQGGKKLAEEAVQQGSKLLAEQALAHSAQEVGTLPTAMEAARGLRALRGTTEASSGIGGLVEKFKQTDQGAKLLQEIGETSQAARRGGVSALSEEQIAKFLTRDGKPLAQRGLGFGIGEHQVKIPFTDRGPLAFLGEKYHGALAKAGDLYYGSKAGEALESARDLKIAARSTDPLKSYEATHTLLQRGVAAREAENLANQANHALDEALKGMSKEERALVPKALQGDTEAIATLGDKHLPVQNLLDALGTKAQAAGLRINKLEDYFPRKVSAETRDVLVKAGVITKKGQMNGPTGFASEIARKLKPGENTFLGVKFTAKNEAEVAEKAGQIAREKLMEVDPKAAERFGEFFSTDTEKVLKGYISGWSRRVAQSNAAQTLYERGIGSEMQHVLELAPKTGKKISKLEAALAAVGAKVATKEGSAAAAEAKSEGAQRELLAQRLAQIENGGPTPTAAAPVNEAAAATATPPLAATISPADVGPPVSYINTRADLADALIAKDVMGARESFAELVKQNGVTDPRELSRIVDAHFVEGPGGLISDDKAIMRYVRNTEKARAAELTDPAKPTYFPTSSETPLESPVARREASAVSVSNQTADASQIASQAPEQVQADIAQLEQKAEQIRSILSSSAKVPESARTHLTEMQEAIAQDVKWGRAQASDQVQADRRLSQIAGYERSAAKARQELANLKQTQLGYEQKLEHLSAKTVDHIVDASKHAFETEIKRGIGTPDEVAHWLADADQWFTPEGMRKGLKHWDSAVGIIKDYQIAYPGFHVRNAMGGIFNNAEAGIHTSSYGRLIGMWRRAANDSLRPSETKLWEQVQTVVGKGQIGEESLFGRGASALGGQGTLKKFAPWSRENLLIKGSRWTGEQVEFFLRGSLALDTLKRGGSIDDAVQMVNKFHFDYGELSQFEQKLRHVVPFYTWTRKNLPLQVEQLVKNPKFTSRYMALKADIEAQSDADSILPGYIPNDLLGIRTPVEQGGGHVYATPDLPLRDLPRFMGSPGDTWREALGMVTPIIKAPIEATFNKQVFKNLPIEDGKYVPLPLPAVVVKGLAPALKQLGVVEEVKGKYFLSQKNAYLLDQAVPLIARARRLFPKEDKLEQRRMTTWLSLFGLGARTNTQAEQEALRTGQKFAERDAKRRQRALEKAAGG